MGEKTCLVKDCEGDAPDGGLCYPCRANNSEVLRQDEEWASALSACGAHTAGIVEFLERTDGWWAVEDGARSIGDRCPALEKRKGGGAGKGMSAAGAGW